MSKNRKVHEVGDCIITEFECEQDGLCFVISHAGGGWMPGAYDSKVAAIMGFDCCMEDESAFVSEVKDNIDGLISKLDIVLLSSLYKAGDK